MKTACNKFLLALIMAITIGAGVAKANQCDDAYQLALAVAQYDRQVCYLNMGWGGVIWGWIVFWEDDQCMVAYDNAVNQAQLNWNYCQNNQGCHEPCIAEEQPHEE